MKLPIEERIVLQRRALVRSYLSQGLRVIDIVARLEDEDTVWFPDSFTFKEKIRFIEADVKGIQKHIDKSFEVSKDDADRGMKEYLERQESLYREAYSLGKWELAQSLSKDIARARGVPVDEVVRVKTDFGSLLMAASNKRREQAQLPPPIEDAIVIPPPDSRLLEVQKVRRKPEEKALENGHSS